EIRARLATLTDDDVAGLVEAANAPEPMTAPAESALDYIRGLLGGLGGKGSPGGKPTPPLMPVPASGRARATSPAHPVPPASARPQFDLFATVAPTRPAMQKRASGSEPDAVEANAAAEPDRAEPRPGLEAPEAAAAIDPTDPTASIAPTAGRSQWDRIALTPDIELHVRRPLRRLDNKRVERLITIARQVLGEEKP
ncbi:MAG TPA: hypothetical protein VFX65_07530, partial [Candidatus Limnocylindrales bacterium]|nr:hypothetical protein [Candidatus Limnocylindrales bacterium]